MSEEWSERPALARAGLERLSFLLGEWAGTGSSDGHPIRGRLVVQSILGGTFYEAAETLRLADGTLDHEDRVLYRYALEDHSLRALHLQAPSWISDHYVDLLTDGEGLAWSGGPTVPRVQITHTNGTLVVEVRMPGESAPATHLTYTRV